MRIAFLDDEVDIGDHLAGILRSAGYICQGHTSAKALLATLRRDTFDLVILDWNVPDMSGLEVLGWIRSHIEHRVPILFVTSRSDEADIVAALDAGADDYVMKPVKAAELLARVAALLRRAYPAPPGGIERFGNHAFDVQGATVSVDGAAVAVTAKEFELALLLFRNLHRALSRDYVLEKVWGHGQDVLTRTLDAHVSRIRVKLKLRPENGYRLLPIYSYGYRLERLEAAAQG